MSKNAKPREHVYVVLRIDKFHGPTTPVENMVSVTKIFWTLDEAKAEVARLNELKDAERSVYMWRLGRLQAMQG